MVYIANEPYDSLFRLLFWNTDRADSLIREYLPPRIRNELSSQRFQPHRGSWIDSHLIGHQADILYEGRLERGDRIAAYMLLEHKSYPKFTTYF